MTFSRRSRISGIVGIVLFLGFLLVLFSAQGDPVYLLNEDSPPFEGMIVCANSCTRTPFKSGLGTSGKKDTVEISLSFVNQGKNPVEIDPNKDFTLAIHKEYAPEGEAGKTTLDRLFTLHPGTQSRGSLIFHVEEQDKEEYPLLTFRKGNGVLVFCCDPNLGTLLEQSTTGGLDLEKSLKLSQFLVDNERMDLAEKVVNYHYERQPDHPLLALQKMAVLRWFGKHQEANDLVRKLSDSTALAREDAVSIARGAFEQGQMDVARKLLEPLGEKAQLEDAELLLLARCWYFDRAFEQAETLLKQLYDRGVKERVLFFTLGNIADKRDEWAPAIKWWEKCLEVDPAHFEARFNIGVAYYKMGNIPEAKANWTKVLGMNPDSETRKMTENALNSVQ